MRAVAAHGIYHGLRKRCAHVDIGSDSRAVRGEERSRDRATHRIKKPNRGILFSRIQICEVGMQNKKKVPRLTDEEYEEYLKRLLQKG